MNILNLQNFVVCTFPTPQKKKKKKPTGKDKTFCI